MSVEKINDIKMILNQTSIDELPIVMDQYKEDPRAGVQKLLASASRRIDSYYKEEARIEQMLFYERKYSDQGVICGIDEAGRGPLAGPVVAAAVILPENTKIFYLNDSKQLSEKKREALYDEIMEKAISVGVGIVSPDVIDDINILQADYEAMRDAVRQLEPEPNLLLNDAVTIPGISIRQIPIIKGDAKSLSIAAASVIAKVTRDRMMTVYDEMYPEYGFAKNKGYGTKDHVAALKLYGPTPIHRRSFIGNFV